MAIIIGTRLNIVETRSVVPNLRFVAEFNLTFCSYNNEDVFGDIGGNVTIIGYKDACGNGTCSPFIRVSAVAMQYQNLNYTCQEFENSCVVNFVFAHCAISETSEIGKILITSTGSNAFAYGYQYNVTASTGYMDSYSIAVGRIFADEGVVFRGLEKPTEVALSLVNTVTKILSRDASSPGFFLDPITQTPGSTVDELQFNWKRGLQFSLELREAPNTLEISQSERKNVFRHIVDTLAGAVGIISSVGLIMRLTEKWVVEIFEKIRDLILRRKPTTKKAKPELMQKLLDGNESSSNIWTMDNESKAAEPELPKPLNNVN